MGLNCLLKEMNNSITSAIFCMLYFVLIEDCSNHVLSGDNGILLVIMNNDLNISLITAFPVMKNINIANLILLY